MTYDRKKGKTISLHHFATEKKIDQQTLKLSRRIF